MTSAQTNYISMPPNETYQAWGYCTPPTFSENDSLREFYDDILSCQVGEHHLSFNSKSQEIRLTHNWTKCSCWCLYDAVRENQQLSLDDFIVRKPEERTQDETAISATISIDSSTKSVQQKPTREELVETAREYHPFDVSEVSAEDVEFKCGDISSIFFIAFYYEYGIEVPIIAGGIFNPKTMAGWSHGFLQVKEYQVKNQDNSFFIDGTAKQFCDESGFEQTLGPEKTIDGIEVLDPTDERFKYYALDRDRLDS